MVDTPGLEELRVYTHVPSLSMGQDWGCTLLEWLQWRNDPGARQSLWVSWNKTQGWVLPAEPNQQFGAEVHC